MTRINTIDPAYLTDQHCFAEFREITRVSRLAKSVELPAAYTMGTGHVKFFYDKGLWLADRLWRLQNECDNRNIRITPKVYVLHPQGLNRGWTPTYKDHLINIERLHEKLANPPRENFYTYRGKPIAEADWYLRLASILKPQ